MNIDCDGPGERATVKLLVRRRVYGRCGNGVATTALPIYKPQN